MINISQVTRTARRTKSQLCSQHLAPPSFSWIPNSRTTFGLIQVWFSSLRKLGIILTRTIHSVSCSVAHSVKSVTMSTIRGKDSEGWGQRLDVSYGEYLRSLRHRVCVVSVCIINALMHETEYRILGAVRVTRRGLHCGLHCESHSPGASALGASAEPGAPSAVGGALPSAPPSPPSVAASPSAGGADSAVGGGCSASSSCAAIASKSAVLCARNGVACTLVRGQH